MTFLVLTANGQVNIHTITLSYGNDSVHLKTELRCERDTSFFHQLLVCAGSQNAPMILIQDTFRLEKEGSNVLFHSVPKAQIIDTNFFYTLLVSGYCKQKKFIAYSSLQPGLAISTQNLIPGEMPRNCGISKSDSGIYISNPYCTSMGKDSIGIQIHSLNQQAIPLDYSHLNTPCFNIEKELFHVKNSGTEIAWVTLCSGTHQLCRSQNFKIPEKPIYDSIPLKAPSLRQSETELTELDKDRIDQLKKDFLPPLVSGSIMSESNFQNYRYPLSQRDPNYSRLYLNATLTPFGIPFDINSLVTTEHHTGRKLNYFTVSFDQRKWEENRAKRIAFLEQCVSGRKSELEASQRRFENQLYSEKKELESLIRKGNPLKDPELPDSLRQIVKPPKLPDSTFYIPLPDTAIGFDTLTSMQLPFDTSLVEYRDSIAQLQARIESLSNKLTQLKELLKKVAALQGKITQLKESQNPLKNFKKLQAGDIYPYFNPLTLEGVQVRGVNTAYGYKGINTEVFLGKTMVPRKTFFADSAFQQELSRNAAGLKIEYTGIKDQKLALSFLHFNDTKDLSTINFQGHIKNTVFSIQHEIQAGKKLKIEANAAISDLNYLSLADTFELAGDRQPQFTNWLNNSALEIRASWMESAYKLEFETGIKRVGPNYYSAGVPFLRTNYGEWIFKTKKSLMSGRLLASLNYSLNVNDLDRSMGYRTQMQGFGFQLNTRFKKSPNVFISYLPFRSVSEYRPNEFQPNGGSPFIVYRNVIQNKVLLILATYQSRILSQDLDLSATYSLSTISIDEVTTQIQMFGFNGFGSYKEKLRYGLRSSINYQSKITADSSTQVLHGAFVEYIFRRIKLKNGFEYAAMGKNRRLFSQTVGLSTNLYGIEISSELFLAWENANYFPSATRHPTQFQIRIGYQF